MSDTNDFMAIGETNLVPTEYGFVDKETGEKFGFDGKPLQEDDNEDSTED